MSLRRGRAGSSGDGFASFCESGFSHSLFRLRGQRFYREGPISLNENRDAARPYHDTTGGKILIYTFGKGAVLLPKEEIKLKAQMKLSWDDEPGVVMVPENEPTRHPSWKYPRS